MHKGIRPSLVHGAALKRGWGKRGKCEMFSYAHASLRALQEYVMHLPCTSILRHAQSGNALRSVRR